MTRLFRCSLSSCLAMLAACRREAPAPASYAPSGATATPRPPALPPRPCRCKDVVETTPRYVIGISYPKSAAKYPGLASALRPTRRARARN